MLGWALNLGFAGSAEVASSIWTDLPLESTAWIDGVEEVTMWTDEPNSPTDWVDL